jgi:soluble lytic murein transglycosylase
VSPGASTKQARSRSRRSSSRSRARRTAAAEARKRGRKRRFGRLTIGFALVLALAIGLGIANREQIEDTLREAVILPLRHEDIIRQQAAEKDVPADLIAAVIYAESRFRDQESHAGARGLMQVTPATAELIEEESGGSTFEADDLSDPDLNIAYGTFYLRYLLDRFDQNLVAALAAYNGGETNVAAWGGQDLTEEDIEFDETRDYVDRVLEKREEYRDHYADELGLE